MSIVAVMLTAAPLVPSQTPIAAAQPPSQKLRGRADEANPAQFVIALNDSMREMVITPRADGLSRVGWDAPQFYRACLEAFPGPRPPHVLGVVSATGPETVSWSLLPPGAARPVTVRLLELAEVETRPITFLSREKLEALVPPLTMFPAGTPQSTWPGGVEFEAPPIWLMHLRVLHWYMVRARSELDAGIHMACVALPATAVRAIEVASALPRPAYSLTLIRRMRGGSLERALIMWRCSAIELTIVQRLRLNDALDPDLRERSIDVNSALEQLSRWRGRARPIVPLLIPYIREVKSRQLSCLLEAMNHIGPQAEEAVPALIEKLASSKATGFDQELVMTLAGIGPSAVPALDHVLRSEQRLSHGSREGAAYALALIGPTALPSLKVALSSSSNDVRLLTAEALASDNTWIRNLEPAHRRSLAALLIPVLRDPNPDVRRLAIQGVPHAGPRSGEAAADLVAILEDDASDLRVDALRSLTEMACDSRLLQPALTRILSSPSATDRDPLTFAALDAVAELAPPAEEIVPVLIRRLEHPGPQSSFSLDHTLGALAAVGNQPGATAALDRLLPICLRPGTGTAPGKRDWRPGADAAIIAMGPDASEAIPLLFETIVDYRRQPRNQRRQADLERVADAARILAAIGPASKEALPELAAVLRDINAVSGAAGLPRDILLDMAAIDYESAIDAIAADLRSHRAERSVPDERPGARGWLVELKPRLQIVRAALVAGQRLDVRAQLVLPLDRFSGNIAEWPRLLHLSNALRRGDSLERVIFLLPPPDRLVDRSLEYSESDRYDDLPRRGIRIRFEGDRVSAIERLAPIYAH